MLRFLLFLLLVQMALNLAAQHRYVDLTVEADENYRLYEGGATKVAIDWQTPLEELIERLNSDWYFVDTGKGYWIGYTDDMYSIAARKDTPIPALLHLIETSSSRRAQIGAIYCLHLIGINSRIAGRMYEQFTNKQARATLLHLLKYSHLQPMIMKLLIRDPWLSDIPKFFEVLETDTSDNGAILSGMFRYKLTSLPLQEKIPENIYHIPVRLPLLKKSEWSTAIVNVLQAIKQTGMDSLINIDDTLFTLPLQEKYPYNMATSTNNANNGLKENRK